VLTLRTLGGPRLDGPGGELLHGRRKELALLAYLARHARGASREALAELLWGSRPDANARQSLRQALLQLKKAVPGGLDADAETVRLTPGTLALDAGLFEAELAAGRLEEAFARWQGDFLAGCDDLGGDAFRAWLDAERQTLRTRLHGALAALVDRCERLGETAAALAWSARWADAFPLDEEAAARHIQLLHGMGQRNDAAARQAAFTARIRRELERDPSAAFAQRVAGLVPGTSAARPAPTSGALFTPELVGRRAALAALESAWTNARTGTTMLVLVEGEDGGGKTRLIEEFIRRTPPPFILLRARGSDVARRDPYATLRDLLAGVADAPGLTGARPSSLATLAQFAPAIRERARLPDDAAETVPADALADVLGAVAAEVPILMFVDDVSLVDRESRELLLNLARRVRQVALCCICTSRSADTPPELIAELRGRAAETRIRLSALSVDEVESLVTSMLDLAPQWRATVAARLHAESGGNPFYLMEALAALVDEGRIVPDDRGVWHPAAGLAEGALPMPATLRAAVRRRLGLLSPEARLVGAAAAVLTPVATRASLAGVTQLGDDELDAALEELELRRVLRAADATGGTHGFVHDVTRRAMLDLVPGAERRRMQRRARQADHSDGAAVRRARRRRRLAGGAAAIASTVTVALLATVWRGGDAAPAVYVVGRIQDHSGDQLATAFADMLTTSLARVPGLSVVSTARMYELTAGDTARVLAAARRAGATVLLEGAVFRSPTGNYRLDLQGGMVETGRVLSAHRLEGASLFALVDSATAAVARTRGADAAVPGLAAQTTTSLAAYRLYSEGLRAYHLRNTEAARALLDAAVAEDSSFALAWLWGARAYLDSYPEWRRRMDRAVALAPRAPERERLLILSDFATYHDAPERLALAETLATRFPADAEAHLQRGVALQLDGQFLAAADAFGRALALDRGGLAAARTGERCLACEAVSSISGAYRMADSMDASVRVAREWTRAAPAWADAWYVLADALMYAGRAAEALAVADTAFPLDTPVRAAWQRALIAVHAEDWDAGAQDFERDLARPELAIQGPAAWWMIIIRRNQGRFEDALALARRYVALGGNRLPEAQVRFERREYLAAARLFAAIAAAPAQDEPPSRRARDIAWYLTHTATALAAAGDTATLAALADSVQGLGGQTAYGRDRLLQHHIRGLLLSARGRHAEAIERFRRAIFSPTSGYTRSNYELARQLIDAGRPAEAVAVLRPTLHDGLEASAYYLTRTDVHALLGEAFEAAGQPDSALAHYRRAITSWRDADPPVAARRREMERRVEEILRRPARTR